MWGYRLHSFWTRFTFNLTILKMALLTIKDVEAIEGGIEELSNPEILKKILDSLRNSQRYFRSRKPYVYPFIWKFFVWKAMERTFKLILKLEDRIESLSLIHI